MSGQLGTRIIDGDGHIMEDNAGIIAHMKGAYREIAARKGICFPPLDHLHSGAPWRRRRNATTAPVGPRRLAGLSRRRRYRLDRPVSDPRALLRQNRQPRLRRSGLQSLQRLDDRDLPEIQFPLQGHGDYSHAGP